MTSTEIRRCVPHTIYPNQDAWGKSRLPNLAPKAVVEGAEAVVEAVGLVAAVGLWAVEAVTLEERCSPLLDGR